MAKRIGGFRRKTRDKLKKPIRNKGKISIKNALQEFREGDRVTLIAEPAVQKGMYFPRFHSRTGVVSLRKGDCYEVLIKDGKKAKTVTVHPVHLRRVD